MYPLAIAVRIRSCAVPKQPLFTIPMFLCGGVVLRRVVASFRQCVLGLCARRNGSSALLHLSTEALVAVCIFVFAITLTLAAIMWVKALHHQWFSTMYGVYYFAGAVWTTIATVYVITIALQRTGPLREVVHEETYYFLGSLQLAFTVFYAYIHFSHTSLFGTAIFRGDVLVSAARRDLVEHWSHQRIRAFLSSVSAALRIDCKLSYR